MGKKNKGRVGLLTLDVVKSAEQPTTPRPVTAPSNSSTPPPAAPKSTSLENVSIELDNESPLEKLMNKASDEASLNVFAQAWNNEVEAKRKLWESNIHPSYEEFEKLISSKKLDSNLKKCTSFVRKLRQYTESQKSSVENDVKTLNLTKYLTEIAAGLTEARYKLENISDAASICSMIHQRYSEFSGILVENFKKSLPAKKSDMGASILSKLSVDIRMIGELVVCGVIPKAEGCSLLASILRNLVATDKEGLQCLIPIMSFAIGLGDPFMGVLPRRISALCNEYGVTLARHDFLSKDAKTIFKNLVFEYFSVVSNALIKVHQEKQRSELYNRKLLRTKGEIPSDRKESHLAIQAKFDKYMSTAAKFADILDCDLPMLVDLPIDPEEEEEKALLMSEMSGDILDTVPGIIVFEDEETRSFYQDFKDLKVYLPPVAYRESLQQAAEETQQIEAREKALNDFDDAVEAAELEEAESSVVEDDSLPDVEADLPPSFTNETEEKDGDTPIKATFQDYLDKLLTCCGRNSIDKVALEFAENHNNKSNRKKLVYTLFRVPRQRTDLLPFYGRLVAVLNPVMPDVGLELCRMLKNDFFFLVKKKHQIFIETKLKIVRFIGELVNFRIFPKSDALHCLKILLMNFVHHQIEMACVLVETCGRMLYRTSDSHRRMKIYMEEMIRKKTVKSLELRYVSMIDHAHSVVLPRDDGPKIVKKLTAIELFLEPILIEDLCKGTYKQTFNLLKSLPWDDPWVAEVACRYLTMPWLVTHQQLQLQAQLLLELLKAEPHVVTRIIDIVMEELRRGLEHPGVHFNQRRFSTLTYLSELYYYRLLRSDTVFDVMYLLITYGVSWDLNKPTVMDPPDNLGRIRLACFLLKDCGEYLNHGNNKKKLRLFLLHLQKYYWLKRSQIFWNKRRFPFGVYEVFEEIARKLNPKMKFSNSFQEAVGHLEEVEGDVDEEFQEASGKLPKLVPISDTTGLLAFMDPMEKYNETQEQLVADSLAAVRLANAPSSRLHDEYKGLAAEPIAEEDDSQLDPYERAAARSRQNLKQNFSLEDEEFNSLFDKMCSEVNYSGKQMKTDITIPLHISNSAHSTSETKENMEEIMDGPAPPPDTVPFVLITRKGNKQHYKTLPLPADSDFVQRIRTREEMERIEKENVKRRTLAISQLQEDEERQKEVTTIRTSFTTSPREVVVNKYKEICESSEHEETRLKPFQLGSKTSDYNRKSFMRWTKNNKARIVQGVYGDYSRPHRRP